MLGSRARLEGTNLDYYRLARLSDEGIGDIGKLPVTVKILLEGLLRDSERGKTSEVSLTEAQAQVVGAIDASLGGFTAHLLYGVTGSGKTEVYLRVIAAAIAAGGQALVLVPEIGLTPQLVERFRQRFSTGVVVLHSALTGTDRRDAWRAAHGGHARIVIGTRSAVFASLPRLALIVVDYLQLMRPTAGTRQENRVQEVSDITRGLKAIAISPSISTSPCTSRSTKSSGKFGVSQGTVTKYGVSQWVRPARIPASGPA